MMKKRVTARERISAVATESQIASGPNNAGSAKMQTIWNRSVLPNEIIALTTPLFKAVKKAEAKIL